MSRSRARVTLAAAAIGLQAMALYGGVNQWTTHGPSGYVIALAADPVDPRTIYATGDELSKTVDGGETWQGLDPGSRGIVTCLAVDPADPGTVYAARANGEILRSHDGGIQWENRLINPEAHPISMAIDAGTGAIYIGTDFNYTNAPTSNFPVFRSADGGTTWNGTALRHPRGSYALLADSLSRTLLVGSNFGSTSSGFYPYPFGGSVARTVDGGASWSFGRDLSSPVVALAKDSQGSAYYAGTVAGTLFRSVDGGASWEPLANLPGTVTALAVDPRVPSVLYAATQYGRGLLRSMNGGASWRSFNSGLASRYITALTIDSTGRFLHVGTDLGVFDLEVAPEPAPEPCEPAPDRLCFFGSRFQVDLTAIDPFTKTPFAAHAIPGVGQSGYFAFPSLTGDPTFPEVMVKMVDATSLPGGGFWVYYGGMTGLLYTLRITDTTTGTAREYGGENSCGGADVSGFLAPFSPSPWDYFVAAPPLRPASATDAPGSGLGLLLGRFQITMRARHPGSGTVAGGLAIPQDDRFGSFSLPAFTGDPDLPEVFVKMIDAGGGLFLFFHTALTSLDYALTVVDTVTKTERTYLRENGDPSRPCGGGELLMFPK